MIDGTSSIKAGTSAIREGGSETTPAGGWRGEIKSSGTIRASSGISSMGGEVIRASSGAGGGGADGSDKEISSLILTMTLRGGQAT